MCLISFPPVEQAMSDGLLAVGGKLSVSSLLTAYTQGIFPWPIDEKSPCLWFSPDPRGILEYKKLHISRSLQKVIKKNIFKIKFNTNFEAVITACKKVHRKEQDSTWITDKLRDAYINLFLQGKAYSLETYNQQEQLVGGIYGVNIGQYYSGESMFHHEPNASKVALVTLCTFLFQEKGVKWIDIQMISPLLERMGGSSISRDQFILQLKKSISITNP